MDKQGLLKLIKKYVDLVKGEGVETCLLSGGIDSGILTALADPKYIFTARLPYGSKYDEYEDTLKTVNYLNLEDRLITIELDESRVKEILEKAVKAIGRPIPHFNIFPFFLMCEKIAEMGITKVMCGDGPDESMSGYTRHLIMNYLYSVKKFPAFDEYHQMIDKVLPEPAETYAMLIGKPIKKVKSIMSRYSLIDGMCAVDMTLMRPDMDDMTDKIAAYFGITLYRPYQYPKIDAEMFKLPPEMKIRNIEFGKALLRDVASDLIPREVAWRKQKIGGPVVPINDIMGWDCEPFDKTMYLKYQEDILNG